MIELPYLYLSGEETVVYCIMTLIVIKQSCGYVIESGASVILECFYENITIFLTLGVQINIHVYHFSESIQHLGLSKLLPEA